MSRLKSKVELTQDDFNSKIAIYVIIVQIIIFGYDGNETDRRREDE
ncbi:hypothetical protein LL127_11365 [Clostridium estertheticum]|nr:hypothetical protein [Clostridium estertheticum]MCB2307907.1 hypothetical protein [Clostridium estertheticum]MCB2346031.1 hypothetical protein [Clostridium estertheticum]WAG44177.1 hypothetical protein LL127_11365 [Clostridium estertheticum]